VDVVELHELSGEQQQQLLAEINLVSRFPGADSRDRGPVRA